MMLATIMNAREMMLNGSGYNYGLACQVELDEMYGMNERKELPEKTPY